MHKFSLYIRIYLTVLLNMHSATQNVSMGKEKEGKRIKEGDCKLLPYVYAQGVRQRWKPVVPSDSGLKCFNHDDTATD